MSKKLRDGSFIVKIPTLLPMMDIYYYKTTHIDVHFQYLKDINDFYLVIKCKKILNSALILKCGMELPIDNENRIIVCQMCQIFGRMGCFKSSDFIPQKNKDITLKFSLRPTCMQYKNHIDYAILIKSLVDNI